MFHASCDFVVSRYPHLMTDRPRVDVVVPFIGSDDALITLCAHLRDLRRRADDTVYVVDNRPEAGIEVGDVSGGLRIVRAPERQTSYHARNKGVAAGNAPWLVFVDADVRVPPDLIDRYFEPEPQKRTGILAGEIHDEPSTHRGEESISIRYAHLARVFAQEAALDNDRYSYAMTANCAIRRDAFEAVGGFVEHIRSGGDADICIRIQQSGWAMERRLGAVVAHVNRDTIRKLLRQSARHGSGAAWLERAYPGFSRPSRVPGSWGSRRILRAAERSLRGDRDAALVAFVDGARSVAFDFGRYFSNEIPANNGAMTAAPSGA